MKRCVDPSIHECYTIPGECDPTTVYRLLPVRRDEQYYRERTDRNIGWITTEEQAMLQKKIIGIAGCGGMGGLLASIFFRLGIGEIRIADTESFDISNINRQFAAGRLSIGKSKALETARMVREILNDGTLVVYSQGITEETSNSFLSGCDIVCDEIEFWAVGSRILLHKRARELGISLFNCNSVGFGTRLFLFTPEGETIEKCLGLSYRNASEIEKRILARSASKDEVQRVMDSVLRGLIPEIPEYSHVTSHYQTAVAARMRLVNENAAPIIATNPPMAAGFLANHVLLYLLRESGIKRATVQPPPVPGYLYFDSGLMDARAVVRKGV